MALNPSIPLITVDPDILEQVLINLLRNALEATGEAKGLFIKSYESGKYLHIDLKNSIDKPVVKNPEVLFLPFDEGGQSIGLPLCYQLVKNMGGLLTFDQSRHYMTFTISLPKKTNLNLEHGSLNTTGNSHIHDERANDRRQEPRFEVKWESTIAMAIKAVDGIIENISPGGAYVVCEDPPNLFETFQMEIRPSEGRRITIVGQVAWKNFHSGISPGIHGIGVRFININSDLRSIVEQMTC